MHNDSIGPLKNNQKYPIISLWKSSDIILEVLTENVYAHQKGYSILLCESVPRIF